MTVLKAKIAGSFLPVLSGYASNVFIGPDPPTDPNMQFWVDTDAVLPVPPWTNISPFQNGWTNETPYVTQYRKVGDIVYIRGSLTPGSSNVAFTMPAGYRPPTITRLPLGGWTGSAYQFASGLLGTDGTFSVFGITAAAGALVIVNVNWSTTA